MKLLKTEIKKLFKNKRRIALLIALLFLSFLQLIYFLKAHNPLIEKYKAQAIPIINKFKGPLDEERYEEFKKYADRYNKYSQDFSNDSRGVLSSDEFDNFAGEEAAGSYIDKAYGSVDDTDSDKAYGSADDTVDFDQALFEEEKAYNVVARDALYVSADALAQRELLYGNAWHYLFDWQKIIFPFIFLIQFFAISAVMIEEESGIKPVIIASSAGRENVARAKELLLSAIILIAYSSFFIFRLAAAQIKFNFDQPGAAASSLKRFEFIDYNCSLFELAAAVFFTGLFAYLAYAFILLLIADISKSTSASFIASLLLLIPGLVESRKINLSTFKLFMPASLMQMQILEASDIDGNNLRRYLTGAIIQLLLFLICAFAFKKSYKNHLLISKSAFNCSKSKLLVATFALTLASTALTACGGSQFDDCSDNFLPFPVQNIFYQDSLILKINDEQDYSGLYQISFDYENNTPRFEKLLVNPLLQGPYIDYSNHYTVEGNYLYYQLFHLKDFLNQRSEMIEKKPYALELRRYDLAEKLDRSLAYLKIDERLGDILSKQNGLMVSLESDEVFIVLDQSFYKIGKFGLGRERKAHEMHKYIKQSEDEIADDAEDSEEPFEESEIGNKLKTPAKDLKEPGPDSFQPIEGRMGKRVYFTRKSNELFRTELLSCDSNGENELTLYQLKPDDFYYRLAYGFLIRHKDNSFEYIEDPLFKQYCEEKQERE